MKIFQLLFCLLFLVALSLSLNSVAFAQKSSLPAELTENSSLTEIIAWLDKTSFAQARIGLNIDVTESNDESFRTDADRFPNGQFSHKASN